MEGFAKNDDFNDDLDGRFQKEVYTKVVRAGKRTYFFDVKATRRDEYYLSITESKKHFDREGRFHFEKHKMFLYQEDFEKFVDGLNDVLEFIGERQGYDDFEPDNWQERQNGQIPADDFLEMEDAEEEENDEKFLVNDYTRIEFEDLSN